MTEDERYAQAEIRERIGDAYDMYLQAQTREQSGSGKMFDLLLCLEKLNAAMFSIEDYEKRFEQSPAESRKE